MDRHIVVCIATRYGLDGPGIESRWGRDCPHPSWPALAPTQPPIQRVPGSFPGVERPSRSVDPPPHLEPRLKREKCYTSTPPLGLHDLFQGELHFYFIFTGCTENRTSRHYVTVWFIL